MKKLIPLLCLLGMSLSIFAQTIYYVKTTANGGDDNNDGLTWNTAFANVQTAINTAAAGDQIWVAAGTYQPTENPFAAGTDDRQKTFALNQDLQIYGGFTGTETLLTERNPATNVTILDGNNSYHVFIMLNLTNAAVLDGFTIQGGNGDRTNTDVYEGTNYRRHRGGGLALARSSPIINNCIIKNNAAQEGSGIYMANVSNPTLTNCLLHHNTNLNNNAANSAALHATGSSLKVINCTITDNGNGTFSNASSAKPEFINTIIFGNGTNVTVNNNSQPTFQNCLVENSGASDNWSITGATDLGGNIDENPLFADVANQDYTLSFCSPATNMGNNAANPLDKDLSNQQRISNITIDIGAYEFQGIPAIDDAGEDITQVDNGAFTMAATLSAGNTGTWTIESGTATIVSANSPTSMITDIPINTSAILRWTVVQANCTSVDLVQLTNNCSPTTVTTTLTSDDADNTICKGESVTFTATGGNRYEFFINGISIQNGGANTFTTQALANGDKVIVKVINPVGCSAFSSAITMTVSTFPMTAVFTEHTIADNFSSAYDVYTVDIDSDGDIDVLGVANEGSEVAWWENDGSQVFTKHIIANNFPFSKSVHAVDMDGDSDIDILGASVSQDKITWWENDGSQIFTEHTLASNFNGANSVYAEDMDGDGDMDVLGAAFNDDDIAWWENNGMQVFTKHTIETNFSGANSVYATDIDGDGDKDIVGSAVFEDKGVAWWENDGNQVFTKHILGNVNALRIYALDIDGDQDVDILSAENEENSGIVVWENDGNQAFTYHSISSGVLKSAIGVYASDIDGDKDVLGADFEVGQITWMENKGNQAFMVHIIDGNFDKAIDVHAMDVDGDGDMDVFGAAADANEIKWWENTLTPAPLTSSDADNAICAGESVTFSYSGGTNYQFFVNNQSVQNSASATYTTTSLADGDKVKVTVTNDNGCSQTSPETVMTVKAANPHSSPFITTWKTDNAGTSNSTSITIPTTIGGYNYDVDWDNDGTFDECGLTGNATHDYGAVGTYTVAIRGDFPHIYFANNGDKAKILSIEQWGDIAWTSMALAFWGCENLVINATDAPDLSGVTSTANMFRNALNLNQSVNHWNVSTVTDMSRMFNGASNFNQPLNNWDVSSVTNMAQMFSKARSFDQPIGNWDVSSVTNMAVMFFGASNFNQPLSNWDVGAVTNMTSMFNGASNFNQPLSNWDVGAVTSMANMFNGASNFNQPLSNWDVSSVTNMTSMFVNADNFNQSISSWEIGMITNMVEMFRSADAFNQSLAAWGTKFNANVNLNNMLNACDMDVTNYDATLTGFNAGTVTGRNLGALNLEYCAAKVDRDNLVLPAASGGKGWTISGDAISADCCTDPILTDLTDESICVGGNFMAANVTTSVTNSGTVNYQWYNNNGTNNPNTNAISGQTTATLTALPTTAGTYQYRVEATRTNNADCKANKTVTLVINALPTATAMATPATCQTGTSTANSNGKITISGFATGDKYQYSTGTTFNVNNAIPATATTISADGVIVNNLANANQSYTVRITNSKDCSIDRVVNLTKTTCGNTSAEAGPNQLNICGIMTQLAAVAPTTGAGQWTATPTGGSFVDATKPNTQFQGQIGRSYTLTWTVEGANDQVQISFNGDADNDTVQDCIDLCPMGDDRINTDGAGMPDACDCDANDPNDEMVNLPGTIITKTDLDPGLYQSSLALYSTARINPNKVVVFKAGEQITLATGFHAQAGSDFTASIEYCNFPGNTLVETETALFRNVLSQALAAQAAKLNIPLENASSLRIPNSMNTGQTDINLTIGPNPFQEQTTAFIDLPKASQVSLTVFDAQGRLVKMLVHEAIMPAGKHAVNIIDSQIKAGVFYVHLRTTEGSLVRKVIALE